MEASIVKRSGHASEKFRSPLSPDWFGSFGRELILNGNRGRGKKFIDVSSSSSSPDSSNLHSRG